MKNTLKTVALSVALTLGVAVVANAQAAPGQGVPNTTAVLNLTATAPRVVQMEAAGTTGVGNPNEASTGSSATNTSGSNGNGLTGTIDLGNIAPTRNEGISYGLVGFRIRSNYPFEVKASRTGAGIDGIDTGNASNDGKLGADDVALAMDLFNDGRFNNGMRIGATDVANYTFLANAQRADAETALSTLPVSDGRPVFSSAAGAASIARLSAITVSNSVASDTNGTTILTGPAVSDSGDYSTGDNFIDFRIGFGIKPQFFAATDGTTKPIAGQSNYSDVITFKVFAQP